MRLFVVAMLLAMMPIAVCAGEEVAADDWYGQAEVTTGMLQDLTTGEQEPYVDFPLGGYRAAQFRGGFVLDADELLSGPTGAILGVTFHLGNARDWGFDVGWAEYLSVSIGPFGKYDFESGEISGGIMASLIEFAFGGVSEQKKR